MKKKIINCVRGVFMPTLAQRWMDEGIKKGMERGMQQGMERGMERGMDRGMQQGMKKGKLETAENMLKYGIDIDIIVRTTGLARKEIEKLVKKSH